MATRNKRPALGSLRFSTSIQLLLLLISISPCYAHSNTIMEDDSELFPTSVTPVVGILTQPRTLKNTTTEYYVAASYLKWLEVAGVRAIPIPYDASEALVDDVFFQVNGILFPGGGSDVPDSARRIWHLAMEANSNGDYFPIWGTCLGFEYMVQMAAGRQGQSIVSGGFDAENVSLPLKLVARSLLYADSRIREIVATQNVTMNNHHRGIEPSVFMDNAALRDMFYISSINEDRQGRAFVSTIEPRDATKHPYYGVQYHPEKNPFEYATTKEGMPYEDINHSLDGIYVSIHLAQFFGSLLRKAANQSPKRRHCYTNPTKYPLVYTYPMKRGMDFEQSYIIPSSKRQNVKQRHDNARTRSDNNNGTTATL